MLPISSFRNEIIATIRANPVTIIVADTGAGKSTQVPQYLLAEGASILVTQPRRLAARTVAARVAEEIGEELGDSVGFKTAHEGKFSRNTRCLFVTDGLALVRSLLGRGQTDVLVIDEVHEQNLNVEVLLAWAKLQLSKGAKFKVVVMSATMEAQKLSTYFGGAPIINVPGRLFDIDDRDPSPNIIDDVVDLLREGRNVLFFQPGKREVADRIEEIREVAPGLAVLIPLHGEQTCEEHNRAFKASDKPKCIVSTNVAQTSITIPDVDAVVDSGEEKRIEVRDGVEGLYIQPISQADSKQRRGRAGRTKPGIYINHCPTEDQPEYPTPEILRTRLDQTVLRLAEAGFDAEELEFFHQPNKAAIHDAKETLRSIGCLDAANNVTEMGKRIAKMPVSVQFGRMIIEADKLGVVADVIGIAAILETGEITDRENPNWKTQFCPNERESDILAQLAVAKAIHGKGYDRQKLIELGVHPKAYGRFLETRLHLREAVEPLVGSMESSGKREDIIRCIIAGMINHLFTRQGYSRRGGPEYTNGTSWVSRKINKFSVLQFAAPELVVGVPFDLNVKDKNFEGATHVIPLVTFATAVTLQQLMMVAPHLMTVTDGPAHFDYYAGEVVSWYRTVKFNGRQIAMNRMSDANHPEKAALLSKWLTDPYNKQVYQRDHGISVVTEDETRRSTLLEGISPQRKHPGRGLADVLAEVQWKLDQQKPAYQPPIITHELTQVGTKGRTYKCACGQTVEMGVIDYADLKAGRVKSVKLRCPKSSQEYAISLE